MYEQVEKQKENKSRAVANSVAQNKINLKEGFGFVDNRPEAIAQRKVQEMTMKQRSNGTMGKEQSTAPIQRMWSGEIEVNLTDSAVRDELILRGYSGTKLVAWRIKLLRESDTPYSSYASIASELDLTEGAVAPVEAEVVEADPAIEEGGAVVDDQEPIQQPILVEIEQAVENVVEQEVAAAPIVVPQQQVAAPAPQPLSRVALMRKQAEVVAKHSLMEKISQGIQTRAKYSRLNFLNGTETPNRRALKINMALRGDQSRGVIQILAGVDINLGALGMVIAELQTMPAVEEGDIDDAAIEAFAHYTKEGYENVTGIAKGNRKWDRQSKQDRDMTPEEIAKGVDTLASLARSWPAMPKFAGDTVYRVVHEGQGIDSLADNASTVKQNPTSTSVSLDWSRVGDGKTSCQITIISGAVESAPVDTRAVSTYTHEGEILLPPGTTFTKTGTEGQYTTFTAAIPNG